MVKFKQIFSSLFFYLSILTFIIGFQFSDTMVNGWYQQFMPDLGGRSIQDITFLDSLTGYAITNRLSSTDTSFVLKTTNGGDNWSVIHREKSIFTRIEFLNQNTGFVGGSIYVSPSFYILKTTNGGINWYTINAILNQTDMSVLNENTIWLVSDNGLSGGIYCTTNGGLDWNLQFSQYNNNPNKIYMYNQNIGFACTSFELLKTTNSGMNWTQIGGSQPGNGFFKMYFTDSLVGWKCSDSMRMSTNGGLNWVIQILPQGGMLHGVVMGGFSNINRDTIWGVGGFILYPNNQTRNILLRTTNGGTNWLFQVPDTSIRIAYGYPFFINKLCGWIYSTDPTGIHTVSGGDSTFFTSIKKIQSRIPQEFSLFQNYPNPFNPNTRITYSIKSNEKGKIATVKLAVYDITGRQILILINEKQNPGTYEVSFNGVNLSSGVYFYSLFADEQLIDTKRMVLLK